MYEAKKCVVKVRWVEYLFSYFAYAHNASPFPMLDSFREAPRCLNCLEFDSLSSHMQPQTPAIEVR